MYVRDANKLKKQSFITLQRWTKQERIGNFAQSDSRKYLYNKDLLLWAWEVVEYQLGNELEILTV